MSAMTGAAALVIANAVAFAHDDSKYPDWSGQWRRPQGLGIQWDPSKKLGRDEQAPLTPEYQKVFEAGLADQAAGGQGNDPTYTCIPPGMPRAIRGIKVWFIRVTSKWPEAVEAQGAKAVSSTGDRVRIGKSARG